MINVKLDDNGESFVHMQGNLKELIGEGLAVVDMIYDGLHEHDPSDAFAFEHAFYRAAHEKFFFSGNDKAFRTMQQDKLSARQKAKKRLIECGLSEEDADMLCDFAEKYSDVLSKAIIGANND